MSQSFSRDLRQAKLMPEGVDLRSLLGQIDPMLLALSEQQQLKIAGDLLLELTELYASRADALMTAWENAHQDPAIESDFFADLVRQTMALDLTELIEPPPPRKPRRSKPTPDSSIVAPVEKSAILEMLDDLEKQRQLEMQDTDRILSAQEQTAQALEIAHDESIAAWVECITTGIQQQARSQSSTSPTSPIVEVPLIDLPQILNMPWIEVWLGLLLGGFRLEQRGEFYAIETVWVCWDDREARSSDC